LRRIERRILSFSSHAFFARAAGHDTQETQIVAGLRFWF